MLGIGKLEASYYRTVKQFLNMKECVGIIGGTKTSALYFMGYQVESLLFLDPHRVTEVSNTRDSYSCDNPRLIDMTEVDSSMAVGFVVENFVEY
jgi:cysteine protease ATG4